MNRLIEEYLRSSGVRYFRGHHDDEYFHLVDFVVGAYRARLNVHLEVCGPDSVLVSIAADRYYPVSLRGQLDGLIEGWSAVNSPVTAVIHESCDPSLVGVSVCGTYQPKDATALAASVDAAVGSAIDLFGSMPDLDAGVRRVPGLLRDAG